MEEVEMTEMVCVSPDPVDLYDDVILENDDLKLLEEERVSILTELLNKAKLELEKAIQL